MRTPGPVLLEKEKHGEQEKPLPAEKAAQKLATLQLVIFQPAGNPLAALPEQRRRLFLDSLWRAALPRQRMESGSRAAAELLKQARQDGAAAAQESMRREYPAGLRREEEPAKASRSKPPAHLFSQAERQPELLSKIPSKVSEGSLEAARDSLAFVLADFARGDGARLKAAMGEFESRLSHPHYKSADLMATMLLVIEDLAWEGEEGAAGSARHFGAKLPEKRMAVPEVMRQSAQDSAVVRLASVREMLRYYFERHPKEYAQALAAALGITSDQEEDSQFLQERLASELAHIGGFALAQKILAELKRKKKLERDAEKCLLELGYRYDRKNRVLVLGKRTCASPQEARGLLALLLSAAKK